MVRAALNLEPRMRFFTRTTLVSLFALLLATACSDTDGGAINDGVSSADKGPAGTDGGPIASDPGPGGSDSAGGGSDSTGGGSDSTGGGSDSTGGGSDTRPVADAGPGQGLRISDIQQLPAGASCDPASIATILSPVELKGVVVVSPKFSAFSDAADPTRDLDGYFIIDAAGGPYSGVVLTVPTAQATDFKLGDTLDVAGEALEFFCQTEVKGQTVTVTGTTTPPAPALVTVADLADPAKAEVWEGTLVRLENVTVESGPSQFGEYTLAGGALIDDTLSGALNLATGATLDSVVGVVGFSFGAYKLLPRSPSDIVGGGPVATSIEELQKEDLGVNCTADNIQTVRASSTTTTLRTSPSATS